MDTSNNGVTLVEHISEWTIKAILEVTCARRKLCRTVSLMSKTFLVVDGTSSLILRQYLIFNH